ncbi:thiopeptide-type bacteriocin biosynthesis protein [Flavobacteriaceae bacterium KMM 6898]|nr:thiopeptide-type bacteriocin biosynthesis protein [Flavobacteriaceae bacterium KMM 6898]
MKRNFILGEEWLFYKIYCGIRHSDKIIVDALLPTIRELKKLEIIDKWFFVRYNDPDYHLRLRFHLKKQESVGSVIFQLKDIFKQYLESRVIWKVETGMYVREIERYGYSSILLIEDIFYNDSEFVAKSLNIIEKEEELALFTLKSIDCLLEDFQYSETQKLKLYKQGSQAFHVEFKSDNPLKKTLQRKFRRLKPKLQQMMQMDFPLEQEKSLKLLLNERSEKNLKLCLEINDLELNNQLTVSKEEIVHNLIHMHINRIFRTKQRRYELVCYDLLYNYYKSIKYLHNINI